MIGRELMSDSPSPGMYGGYYGDMVMVAEPVEDVEVVEPMVEVMVEEPVMDEPMVEVMVEEPVMDEPMEEEGDDEDVLQFVPMEETVMEEGDDEEVVALDDTDIELFAAANPGCCFAHLIEAEIEG
jgi:hypothetical protein